MALAYGAARSTVNHSSMLRFLMLAAYFCRVGFPNARRQHFYRFRAHNINSASRLKVIATGNSQGW